MSVLTPVRRAIQRATPALALGTAAVTAALAACSDSPTAPPASAASTASAARVPQAFVPGAHFSVAPATTVVNGIARTKPLAKDVVYHVIVQPGGTAVTTSDGELSAAFPAGFVAAPTTFTITAKAGAVVAYDFQPSGTFSKPVVLTLKSGSIAPWSLLFTALAGAQGAYVQNWTQVNPSTGAATVNEFVPTTVDLATGKLTLTLSHFSGYIASWGRSGSNGSGGNR